MTKQTFNSISKNVTSLDISYIYLIFATCMVTNGEFVSRVLNGLQAISKDDRISKRHVLSIGNQKSSTFLAQKMIDRTIYREKNLFKLVNCVELEKIRYVDCPIVGFDRKDTLYRTKKKVEGIIYSRYGSSIFSVTSLDGDVIYNPSTDRTASNNKRRMFGKLSKVYYEQDGYIYIPDKIEAINIQLISLNDRETDLISSCKECDECKSVWDYNFVCPDKILDSVVQQTIQEVASITKRFLKDENPNLDSNEKSRVK